MTLLEVDSLRVQLGGGARVVCPVDGVSLTLRRGEILGVVGESGSGKSVMAHAIMRLEHLAGGTILEGSIRLEGDELAGKSEVAMRSIRGRRIALIPQNPMTSLDPLFCVGSQIVEGMEAHEFMSGASARLRALEIFEGMSIPEPDRVFRQHPHQLSGGLRQRVVIAMALALAPDVIIADEPTTALDVTVQAQVLAILAEACRSRGRGVILITHDLGAVGEICDRVVVMYAGRAVEAGAIPDLLASPKHPYTKALLGCVPSLAMPRGTLRPIPGSVPRPEDAVAGCRFHPRCPEAMSRCCLQNPPTVRFDSDWLVACEKYA